MDPRDSLEEDDFSGETLERDAVLSSEAFGRRVDQAVAELWPDLSRARLQRWLKSGELTVDGRRSKPGERVLGGERLQLLAQQEERTHWLPEPIPLVVVHEDPSLIVINKPAGLVVHPGAGNWDGTLCNALLYHYPELSQVPRAGLVHRLDKDTSGLLVVARSESAQGALAAQLADRSMGRHYLALVEGVPTGPFEADGAIGRDPHNRLRMALREDGRPARTFFSLVERFRAHALVGCRLETGRTHQIRVHSSAAGFPIVGDRIYGARGRLPSAPSPALLAALRGATRQALHAAELYFVHPALGERVTFEVPLPEDFEGWLSALREDRNS